MSPRWAPTREDGLKPWVVTHGSEGESVKQLVWAETSQGAVYELRTKTAVVRRATPADVETLG